MSFHDITREVFSNGNITNAAHLRNDDVRRKLAITPELCDESVCVPAFANPMSVSSDFDGGNLNLMLSSVADEEDVEPTVTAVPRATSAAGNTAWRHFYFRLNGSQGKRPLFVLDDSDYVNAISASPGWRPWYSTDNVNWTRWPSAPTSAGTNLWQFQLPAAFTSNTVWVAFLPAFPLSRMVALRQSLNALYPGIVQDVPSSDASFIADTLTQQTDEQGRTIPQQPIYSFGLWDDSLQPDSELPKQNIVINGAMHAGEHGGDFIMEGFLRFLVSGAPAAIELLEHFNFYVYFALNPMGRWGGHYRGQWDPADLTKDPNRDLSDLTLESTNAVVAAMNADLGASGVVFHLDFHSTQTEADQPPFYWFYGSSVSSTYRNAFLAQMQAIDGSYTDRQSVVPAGSSIGEWVRGNLFDSATDSHSYTPELKERSAIPDQETIEGIGEDFAIALHGLLQANPEQLGFDEPVVPSIFDPVNLGTATASTGASTVVTITENVPAGATVFVAVAYRDGSLVVDPAATDDSSNVYARDTLQPNGSGATGLAFLRASNVTALAVNDQITISGLGPAAGDDRAITAFYIDANLETDGTPVSTFTATATSTPSSGNFNATADTVVLLGALCLAVGSGGTIITQDPNFNSQVDDAVTSPGTEPANRHIFIGDRLEMGMETIAYEPTLNDVRFWVIGIAGYREAA